MRNVLQALISKIAPISAELKKEPLPKRGKAGARLKTFGGQNSMGNSFLFDGGQRGKLKFYRFLRDNVPLLNSAIWTWVRLCAVDYNFSFQGNYTDEQEQRAREILNKLDKRLYYDGITKWGGIRELLIRFFESLFTDGAICGELRVMPSGSNIENFVFADMTTISLENKKKQIDIYQNIDDAKIKLNTANTYYYGLSTSPGEIYGKSIFQSIPFVARVEQSLVSDMHRAMRNAGYQRMHVKITPPQQDLNESHEDYMTKANSYFDDTVAMMSDMDIDKNPITWDDVKIDYIGASAKLSSSNSWYLTHKTMIEDICAGTHLAPFMLGYNYGTTHNWAQFKYELVLRQIETVQQAARSLLDWIANVELALHGFDFEVRYHFDNELNFNAQETAAAEKIKLENIITKLDNNFINSSEAKRQVERIK